jgi:hypothetical protein
LFTSLICSCRTSKIPVWSDTLRPEIPETRVQPRSSNLAEAIIRVHKANELTTRMYGSGDRKKKKRRVAGEEETMDIDPVEDGPSQDSAAATSATPTTSHAPEPVHSGGYSKDKLTTPIREESHTEMGQPKASIQTGPSISAMTGGPQKSRKIKSREAAKARMQEKKRLWQVAVADQAEADSVQAALSPEIAPPSRPSGSRAPLPPRPPYKNSQPAEATDPSLDPPIPVQNARENFSPNASDFSFDRPASGTPATTPPLAWTEIEEMENKALDYIEKFVSHE